MRTVRYKPRYKRRSCISVTLCLYQLSSRRSTEEQDVSVLEVRFSELRFVNDIRVIEEDEEKVRDICESAKWGGITAKYGRDKSNSIWKKHNRKEDFSRRTWDRKWWSVHVLRLWVWHMTDYKKYSVRIAAAPASLIALRKVTEE